MENENNIPNEEVVTPSPEEVLVQMKENMVPKEEAQKWQQKYNELFRSVANGTFSGEDKVPEKTEEEKKADFEGNITDNGPALLLLKVKSLRKSRHPVRRLATFSVLLLSALKALTRLLLLIWVIT